MVCFWMSTCSEGVRRRLAVRSSRGAFLMPMSMKTAPMPSCMICSSLKPMAAAMLMERATVLRACCSK